MADLEKGDLKPRTVASSTSQNSDGGGRMPITADDLAKMLQDDAPESQPSKAPSTVTEEVTPPEPEETQPDSGDGSEQSDSPVEAQPADAGSEDALSQEVDKGKGDWDKLPEDVRGHLAEMAKDLAEGKTTLGQLKRGHRLAGDMEQLRDEIKQLREEREAKPRQAASKDNPLGDIKDEQGLEEIVSDANKFLRWARRNPDGGTYDGVELDRDRLNSRIDLAEQAKEEWVPRRAKEIVQANQFKVFQQQQIQAARNDWPWLSDPDNEDVASGREFLKAVPLLNQTDSPEYWSTALARGHKSMQAEKEARKNPKPATKPQPATVPRAKPVSVATTSPPKPSVSKAITEARQLLGKDHSRNAFARFLQVVDQ